VFYRIVLWVPIIGSAVPLARMLLDRRRRPGSYQGAHAAPGTFPVPREPQERGHAVRLGIVSICGAFVVVANPRGLAFWLVIGIMAVILLWEPVRWLTDYLVRKSGGDGATSGG
jgi:hypothetical protein